VRGTPPPIATHVGAADSASYRAAGLLLGVVVGVATLADPVLTAILSAEPEEKLLDVLTAAAREEQDTKAGAWPRLTARSSDSRGTLACPPKSPITTSRRPRSLGTASYPTVVGAADAPGAGARSRHPLTSQGPPSLVARKRRNRAGARRARTTGGGGWQATDRTAHSNGRTGGQGVSGRESGGIRLGCRRILQKTSPHAFFVLSG
jgi:hypothetical protein